LKKYTEKAQNGATGDCKSHVYSPLSPIESELQTSIFPKNSPLADEKHGLSSCLQHGFSRRFCLLLSVVS
jgi:hypothetical protein